MADKKFCTDDTRHLKYFQWMMRAVQTAKEKSGTDNARRKGFVLNDWV